MAPNENLKNAVMATCIVWTVNFIYNYIQDRPVDRVGKKHSVEMSALDVGFGPLGAQLLWILGGFAYVYQKIEDPKSGMDKVFDMQVTQLSIAMGVLNMTFIYAWMMEQMTLATLFMCMLATVSWALVGHLSLNLVKHKSQLAPGVSKMCVILLQNSVAGLAAIAVLAAVLDIGISLVHELGVKDPVSTVFALGILLQFMSLTAFLDLVYFDEYSRYLITPWLTMPFGLYTMILNNLTKNLTDTTSLSFLNELYHYSLILLLAKIGVSGWRHYKDKESQSSRSNVNSKAK